MVEVSCIPAQWNIRPVISLGIGLRFHYVSEEPWSSLSALPRFHSSTDLSRGYNGSYIPLGGGAYNLYKVNQNYESAHINQV